MTQETMMTQAATTTEGQASDPAGATPAPVVSSEPSSGETGASTVDAGSTTNDQGQTQNAGAPEQYEFKAPDGQSFDDTTLAAFSEVAKELNLTQEGAQKVLDKMGPAMAEKQARQMEAIRSEWESSAKSDKEFGGERLSENVAIAKQALDKFGSPALRELLNETGLGNHPEIIRAFFKAGQAISEDRFIGDSRSGQQSTQRDAASVLYPNTN